MKVATKARSETDDRGTDAKGGARGRAPWKLKLRGLLRHRMAWIGFGLLSVVLFFCFFGPLVAPHGPESQNPTASLTPPSSEYWFGTDEFGRDILSRIMWGARLSVLVGVSAVAVSATVGVFMGVVAGFFRGFVDVILMRIMDVLLSFPGLMMALAVAAIIGTGMPAVIIGAAIAGVPNFARVSRGSTLAAMNEDYVLAARSVGCRRMRVLLRHVLPNIVGPLIVMATLWLAFAVLIAAALSFLGVGVQPPTPEWGAMANAGRHLVATAWWVTTFPSLMIVLFVMGINLFGDALRDALDVNLGRQRERLL